MESGKVLQNPRPSHLSNNINSKAMSNELAQKPTPTMSILERFRALLKQREEEARVSSGGEDDVGPPSTEEVVQLYEMMLAELTFNSKPIITDLTIIAGEQRVHGEGIADAICARIIEVPVEQKLPPLYLLDSIVKNINREYVRHFSSRLPEVFCEAYRQVHPNMHASMRHLFGTWSSVFPPQVLRKIETQLQFSQQVNKQSSGVSSLRPSEAPRPTHSIHVNPKYIRQLDNSASDTNIQHVRGTSSNKIYGQKPAIGYDEFDSDHAEVTSSQVGSERINPAGSVGRGSFAFGANKLHPSSRLVRSLSPSRIGSDRILSSEVDEFAVENSPRRLERASPSNPLFDYGLGRAVSREDKIGEWRRKQHTDSNHNRFETPAAYNRSSIDPHQRPRALIDAYGNDRGRGISNDKLPQVEHQVINGMASKVAPKSWQNTEEEEFDWEDMRPTLADRGRTTDLLPSSVPPLGMNGARHAFRNLNATALDSDIRGDHSCQAQRPVEDDSPLIADDAVSFRGSARGLTGNLPGVQAEPHQNLHSRYPEETWNMSTHLSRKSHPVIGEGRGRDFHVPFSADAVSAIGGERKAPPVDKPLDGDAQFVRPPAVVSTSDVINGGPWSAPLPSATGVWPPLVHKSHPSSGNPVYPQQEPIIGNANANHGPNRSLYVPEQQFNNLEGNNLNSMKLPQLHDQSSTLNQQNQRHSQFLPPQGARNDFLPSGAASLRPYMPRPPLNHGYNPQLQNISFRMFSPNPMPGVQLPLPFHNIPNGSLHLQAGGLPPLPPGPPPASSHMIPISQGVGLVPNQPPGGAYSGLISSLMAQGLISLSKQTPEQDSVGLEFNPDLLKMRHESAINALYSNLPRQCTSCGLRFKCQEEHSSHMDWHVTKNRMSKNRKQKPSRKWFVNASMWLSGAEALGTDAVPGFLPTETVVEKKDDEELTVPADEDQNECALCGEPFEDFFSDEAEEWMYKGAVYMNAPDGLTAGMDRSQLGPIVHAKCRSESTVVSPEDPGHDEGVNTEEGSQRKRLRS